MRFFLKSDENYLVQKIRIHDWNSFILNIDLNKTSFMNINGAKTVLAVQKQLFDQFMQDKNFYAKFGIYFSFLFPLLYFKQRGQR